jgi:hypothetical protein
MRRTMVRYKAKSDAIETNQRLIEGVFEELRNRSPQGVRYLVLRLGDGGFVHFSITDDDATPIPQLEAFRAFQNNIKERCQELPQADEVTIVGNYRMLAE